MVESVVIDSEMLAVEHDEQRVIELEVHHVA